jgi:subtilisin family serine protease
MTPDDSRQQNADTPRRFEPRDDKRWWAPYDEALKRRRSEVQIARMTKAFEDKGIPVNVHRDSEDLPEYIYSSNRIITRDDDAARVYRALGRDQTFDKRRGNQSPSSPAGLHVITLDDARDSSEVLEELDERLGEGVAAHDHVVHVSTWCSSTEALPVPGGAYTVINEDAESDGRRARVLVFDTGLRQGVLDFHRLAGITGQDEPTDLGHYTGHGTFVAGVVHQYAPAAEVRIEAGFGTGGASLESEIVQNLERALDWVPDVINFSGGTRTRGNLPLLAFQVFYEQRLRHLAGTVFVAAAGNDADRGPCWPATFPWTVSVGALDKDLESIAGFSNRGSWVDVYAPGTDIQGVYPEGRHDYQEPPLEGIFAEFPNGVAGWSGTSFAAPMVSGLVAGRMTWSGESGVGASESLLEIARQNALVDVGAVSRSTDSRRR